jgi:hypothetical protein
MTIIASTDLSDYKNGKRANESVTLLEQFGLYIIITVEYSAGFFGYKDAKVIDTFTNYRRAVKCYIDHGGQMRREF